MLWLSKTSLIQRTTFGVISIVHVTLQSSSSLQQGEILGSGPSVTALCTYFQKKFYNEFFKFICFKSSCSKKTKQKENEKSPRAKGYGLTWYSLSHNNLLAPYFNDFIILVLFLFFFNIFVFLCRHTGRQPFDRLIAFCWFILLQKAHTDL